MPNHWHLVLRPAADGELSHLMRWLTVAHAQRWHAHYHTGGTGHLYQGRFKSFPCESDDAHFLALCRYVERNPLRAGLVERAELWPWGALWRRLHPAGPHATHAPRSPQPQSSPPPPPDLPTPPPQLLSSPASPPLILAPWPVARPHDWLDTVNRAQSPAEEDALRTALRRGRPFGSEHYQAWTTNALGLQSTHRNPGRPPKLKQSDTH
jgi:putative transposase